MKTLTQFLGINQLFTSPYHPQANGLTERLKKTIKQIITTIVDLLHQDWDKVLPCAVHEYNTSVQASTWISPFRALYGHNSHFPPEIREPSTGSTLGDAMDWWLSLQQLLALLWHAAQHNLRIMQLQQKRHYDNGCIQMQYKEGDKAWVYYCHDIKWSMHSCECMARCDIRSCMQAMTCVMRPCMHDHVCGLGGGHA